MRIFLGFLAALAAGLGAPSVFADSLDTLFARYGAATPGCAVGVEERGKPPVFRAYGSADLEHAVANSPDTIFEAGSVSKQFTAAAVLTLVHEGKLALTDDFRKYVPEMPDYGTPVTIDALLTHTSGLRDWGMVEELAGWVRTERIYTLDDVLQIASRQRALNYAPGTHWSYTNTGYNLLAIIVARVSGQSLADFTRDRLFVPLGMTHTQWRDRFRRIVPGRAIAYALDEGAYVQLMPFENAYGNGGLLTTVGDLLIWNRALSEGRIGAAIVADMERPAVLANGHELRYGRGLFLETWQGIDEIAHPGATAGYRAWLGRYPQVGLSVALLCNTADADRFSLGRVVSDVYLRKAESPRPVSAAKHSGLVGWYVNDREGAPLQIVAKGDALVTDNGVTVTSAPKGSPGDGLQIGDAPAWPAAAGKLVEDYEGDRETFTRVDGYAPSAADLGAVVGRYHSDEADATWVATLEKDGIRLTLTDRPEATTLLKPIYKDAFRGSHFIVRLVHAADGRVTALRLSNERVWDMRFDRLQ